MLKQSLSQKMLQKLSPQQIQLMKLLQVPTTSLEERIKEELESNPALEEGDDFNEVIDLEPETEKEEAFELDDYINEYIEDDPVSYKLKDSYSFTDEEYNAPVVLENSFYDYMERQLGMLDFESEVEETIAFQLVGSIDEDGYLRRDPEAIIDDLLFSQNIETDKEMVISVLKRIQRFDPPGVAARDLQECLLIQMHDKIKGIEGYPEKKMVFALKILENHFSEFTKKHYERLKKNLFLSESELKESIDEILKLNPKPAASVAEVSSVKAQYILPDFIIKINDGELELSLNNKNAPDLKINDQYVEMIKAYKDSQRGPNPNKQSKDAVVFIKQKIDSAKWFIDAIKQRHHTLYTTMYSIMQFQYDFFTSGDERRLKPMILKDIAEITGLDISTVSRVANSKFVQTEFGTRKLKSFFSESMTTQDGEEVSTLEVKNILRDIIEREDKRKPHSDEKLKDLLSAQGYSIARRTVAKYREQLHIPVARLRKEL
ncbi:RNA polymerase factor sigma-54 [Saprospiraceae bacterium]|nr:RNA polymerase factor sigma-54 [Saprospiraceae bacterium]